MLTLILGTALAVEPPGDRDVALGVGAFFNAGGTFMTQPSDRSHPDFVGEIPFSGWAGFSPGGGLALDLRFKDAIGLEVDLIRSNDQAESEYGINGSDIRFRAKTPAWHLPILLKAGVPNTVVSPNVFVGLNHVMPAEVEFPQPTGIPWQMTAQNGSYTHLMFGFGFETRLPIDGVDLRIPLSFRGSLDPSYPSSATDRATYDVQPGGVLVSMDYDLRWQYHAAVSLGMSFYFL